MNRFRATLAALPDAATAAAFAVAWVAPMQAGLPFVRTMFVTFLLEFFAVHAGGLFVGAAESGIRTRSNRVAVMLGALGMAAGYLGIAWLLCAVFHTYWPFASLALVIGAKLVPLLQKATHPETDLHTNETWAIAVVAYILAVMLTAMLPVPAFGIGEAQQAGLDLPGSGLWVDDPQRPLAAGMFYFAMLAWSRAHFARG